MSTNHGIPSHGIKFVLQLIIHDASFHYYEHLGYYEKAERITPYVLNKSHQPGHQPNTASLNSHLLLLFQNIGVNS